MRKLGLAASIFLGVASIAGAQEQPVDPYDQPPTAAPVAATAPEVPPPVYPPQQMTPPPLPPGYGQAQPTPGYYYPPPGYSAPIYSYPPPPVYYPAPPPQQRQVKVRQAACTTRNCSGERPRYFSLGLHGAVLGINQEINGKNAVLGGAGVTMRFRNRGRFGLELSVDILHGRFAAPPTATSFIPADGPYFRIDEVTRDSFPIAVTPMIYLFRNDETRRVFNMYFLGGVGIVPTTMKLTNQWGERVKQNFVELEGHLGVGLELRFRWFALQADVRGLALFLDDENSGVYYKGVEDGPVARMSWGVQGNLGASIWF